MRANPGVNLELQQRLPSPATQQLSNSTQQLSNSTQQPSSPDRSGTSLCLDPTDQAPQQLPEPPSSCSPSPLSHRRSVSPVSPSSSRLPGGAGQMELDLSPSRGLSPRVESCGHGSDGERGPGSPVLRRHLVSTDESSHQASGRWLTLDRDKNISFLLMELETLREINKKLQEELLHKEEELQRREVEEELKEELREAQGWERPAGRKTFPSTGLTRM
ncbi:uncharacterized protein LOC141776159 isoform X3 [Sebastes fasciatus]|uniref:uncharacterized protein LOC141776159 isoform X3 n=1 Tax=Sebastes fasciatus TaxID=394691 RepID=UPI003D9F3869